jgi:hypothetical protein
MIRRQKIDLVVNGQSSMAILNGLQNEQRSVGFEHQVTFDLLWTLFIGFMPL